MEAKRWFDKAQLHWAAFNGHLSVVQCLCEQGADKEARDGNGSTQLDLADS